MEVKRELLGPSDPGMNPAQDFRARQLAARDMLRGDLEGEALEQYVNDSVLTTTVDKAVAWARGNFPSPSRSASPAARWSGCT